LSFLAVPRPSLTPASMTVMRSFLAVYALIVLSACATPPPAAPPAEPAPAAEQASPHTQGDLEAAARVAAEAWLAHVDAEDYARSWEGAAEPMRQQVTAEQWEQAGRQVRQQVGATGERTLQEARHTTELPQAPAGAYVVLVYRTVFAHGPATEQLVMMLEADGEWRPVGYFVRP